MVIRYEACVACGQRFPVERSKDRLPNHHCSPQFEAARVAAERRHLRRQQRRGLRTTQPFAERLDQGFWLLRMRGDW